MRNSLPCAKEVRNDDKVNITSAHKRLACRCVRSSTRYLKRSLPIINFQRHAWQPPITVPRRDLVLHFFRHFGIRVHSKYASIFLHHTVREESDGNVIRRTSNNCFLCVSDLATLLEESITFRSDHQLCKQSMLRITTTARVSFKINAVSARFVCRTRCFITNAWTLIFTST